MKILQDKIRNAAASSMLKIMSSQEKSQETINKIHNLSDVQLDIMASLSGIPVEQKELHRAIIRGEDNIFISKLDEFDTKLQTGDLILVTGKQTSSKILANSQKVIYYNARSSHVIVVHTDFICIDAMPKVGVSNRLISDVLFDVENDWRVIRFHNLTENQQKEMLKKCAFYLEQPYVIFPNRKPAKKYSYCSELARKIYFDSKVEDCRIPKNIIIKPCDFDKLADQGKYWIDITEEVRPFIEFCLKYKALLQISAKLAIDGLKLNHSRNKERIAFIRKIRHAQKRGAMSEIAASEAIKKINAIEGKMNFSFWDSTISS